MQQLTPFEVWANLRINRMTGHGTDSFIGRDFDLVEAKTNKMMAYSLPAAFPAAMLSGVFGILASLIVSIAVTEFGSGRMPAWAILFVGALTALFTLVFQMIKAKLWADCFNRMAQEIVLNSGLNANTKDETELSRAMDKEINKIFSDSNDYKG